MLLVMPLKLENLPETFQTRDFDSIQFNLKFTCDLLRVHASIHMEYVYR